MKSIKLPSRYYNNTILDYVKKDGDFYIFKPREAPQWKFGCQVMYKDKEYKEVIGMDPEGGPYMTIGYKINGLVLDHFDENRNFCFKKKTSYKICGMSDIHGYLPDNIEECDIVCICGDIMPLEIQRDITQSFLWFKENFFPWINNLPCEKVFLIGGNHDWLLENMTTKAINRFARENCYDKLVYLNNSSADYDGIHIHGCPNVENLEGWAFYTDDGHEYTNISYTTDILLTHMPPKIGNTGYVPKYGDLGSEKLKEIADNRKLKLWFCGHMHEGNHNWVDYNGCKLKNVSIKDDNYQVVNPVTYIDYKV